MASSLTQQLFGHKGAAATTTTERLAPTANTLFQSLQKTSVEALFKPVVPVERSKTSIHPKDLRNTAGKKLVAFSATGSAASQNNDEEAGDSKAKKRTRPPKKGRKSHLLQPPDVEESRRTIFVGNLPNDVTKKELGKLFIPFGVVESVRVRSVQLAATPEGQANPGRAVRLLKGEIAVGNQYSANGFVVFEEEESAEKALAKSGELFRGRHLVVAPENPAAKAFSPQNSVFVGNLPYDATLEELWNFFQSNGIKDVDRVRIVKDRETGRGRGIGYVGFRSTGSVAKSIALRGTEFVQVTEDGTEVKRVLRITHTQAERKSKGKFSQPIVTRREKRKQMQKSAVPGGLGKKEKTRDKTTEKRLVSKETAAVVSSRSAAPTDVMPWMGATANPRKKLARDLRVLTLSAEDKRKIRLQKKKEQQGRGKPEKKKKETARAKAREGKQRSAK